MNQLNWRHLHDLLCAQMQRDFPHADARPFTKEIRAARDWSGIEKLLTRHEHRTRPKVEGAIAEFITRGTWPANLDPKERMWISARLMNATNLTMKLTVRFTVSGEMLPMPSGETEVMFWLLVIQWDCFGLADFLAELKRTFAASRKGPRSQSVFFQPPTAGGLPGDASKN